MNKEKVKRLRGRLDVTWETDQHLVSMWPVMETMGKLCLAGGIFFTFRVVIHHVTAALLSP